MGRFKAFIVGFLAGILALFAMYVSKAITRISLSLATEVSYLNSYFTRKN